MGAFIARQSTADIFGNQDGCEATNRHRLPVLDNLTDNALAN
jgi:hypothetical protein